MISSLLVALALAAPPALDRALLEAALRPVLAREGIPGVAVAIVRGDQIVVDEAFGVRDLGAGAALRPTDLFQIGSVTKAFTATLLVLLAEDGALALDDTVAAHLPDDLALPAWTAEVTLRQLATHTSGLPREPVNRRDVPDSPSVMEPYSVAELYAGLAETRLEAEPGARFAYSNLGYAVLGHVLERAAGKPFEQVLRERLLAPLELEDCGIAVLPAAAPRFATGYWPEDDPPVARPRWQFGEVAAFAGMHATARDVARFLGAQYGGAVLSQDARRLLQEAVVEADAQGARKMALGWFVDELPGAGAVLGHGGEVDSFSAAVAFLPRAQVGIAVLANRGGDGAEHLLRAALEAALPALLAPPR